MKGGFRKAVRQGASRGEVGTLQGVDVGASGWGKGGEPQLSQSGQANEQLRHLSKMLLDSSRIYTHTSKQTLDCLGIPAGVQGGELRGAWDHHPPVG